MLDYNEFKGQLQHTNGPSEPSTNSKNNPLTSRTEKYSTHEKPAAETTCSNKKGFSPSKLATSESGTIRGVQLNDVKNPGTIEGSNRLIPEGSLSSATPHKNYLMRIGVQRKNRKLFQILNRSTKDCFVCSKGRPLNEVVQQNLAKKYMTKRDSYNLKVLNDLVFNENTHLVCVFKDYLIYDDTCEFMKRFYANHESVQRLPKVYDFYDKYSEVFPNYIGLKESKFMFKNIERKQRIIDEKQSVKKKSSEKVESKLLNTEFMEEIDKSNTLIKNYTKSGPRKVDLSKGLENLNLHELVDAFISKDTMSQIDVSQALKKIDNPSESNDLFKNVAVPEPKKLEIPVQNSSRAKSEPKTIVSPPMSRNGSAKHGVIIGRASKRDGWAVTASNPKVGILPLQPQIKPSVINPRNIPTLSARQTPVKVRNAISVGITSQRSYNNTSNRPPSSFKMLPMADCLLAPRPKKAEGHVRHQPPSGNDTPESIEPVLQSSAKRPGGTVTYGTSTLPNMKISVKQVISREGSRASQAENLKKIYYNSSSKTSPNKYGGTQKILLSNPAAATTRAEVSAQRSNGRPLRPSDAKTFKSNFLNTLQKRTVIPHAIIERNTKPSSGASEQKSLASSRSTSTVKKMHHVVSSKKIKPFPVTARGMPSNYISGLKR